MSVATEVSRTAPRAEPIVPIDALKVALRDLKQRQMFILNWGAHQHPVVCTLLVHSRLADEPSRWAVVIADGDPGRGALGTILPIGSNTPVVPVRLVAPARFEVGEE